MAGKPRRQQNTTRRKPLNSVCPFCKDMPLPGYREISALEKFVTDRKKILSRSRSGVCAKHQKSLAREIKRARFLALLPFLVRPTE